MSAIRKMILGLAVATALVGPALVGPASAAQVCYFGVCKDGAPAPAPAAPAPATPAPAPEKTSADPKVLAAFGSWQVVVQSSGRRVIVDTFDDGSKLVIGKVDGEFVFLLSDSHWNLAEGRSFKVKVDIDGDVYTGKSSVLDGQTLAIEHVSSKCLKSMYHGDRATIAIGDDSWELNLANAASAMDAAAGLDTASAD